MADGTDHDRARELAASAIDFELEPGESAWLAAHMQACPACRRSSLMYQADARALARLPDLATPERVRTRLMDEVADRRRPARGPILGVAGAVAVAAAIAGLLLFRGIDAELSGPGASASPSAPPASPSLSPSPPPSVSPSASPPPSPSPTQPAATGTVRMRWRAATLPARNDAAEVRGLSIGQGRGLASLRRPDGSPSLWWTGDGRRWRDAEVASGTFGGATPYLIVPDGAGFVAFGWADRSQSATDRRIWTSPDGLAWGPVLHRSASLGSLTFGMMTVAGDTIVVGGRSDAGDNVMWTSTDATRWTSQPVTETFRGAQLEGLASDGTTFYTFGGVAGDGAVWRSPDGASWERLPGPPNSAMIWGLVASPLGVVAYGTTVRGTALADTVWWSQDGQSWTIVSMTPLPSGPGDQIVRIAPTNDGLLAVWQVGGQPGVRMARSADAQSWQFLDVRGFPAGVVIAKVEQIESTIVAVGYQQGQVVAFYAQAP